MAEVEYYLTACSNWTYWPMICYPSWAEIRASFYRSIRRFLQPDFDSLKYLWKKFELTVRRIHWITFKSNPRWGANCWKAKT